VSGICACAHGVGAHLDAWPRPAMCTVQIRDEEGRPRRCPCGDYRPVARPAGPRLPGRIRNSQRRGGFRRLPRRVPRGRRGRSQVARALLLAVSVCVVLMYLTGGSIGLWQGLAVLAVVFFGARRIGAGWR
jgi:hypothetical protein